MTRMDGIVNQRLIRKWVFCCRWYSLKNVCLPNKYILWFKLKGGWWVGEEMHCVWGMKSLKMIWMAVKSVVNNDPKRLGLEMPWIWSWGDWLYMGDNEETLIYTTNGSLEVLQTLLSCDVCVLFLHFSGKNTAYATRCSPLLQYAHSHDTLGIDRYSSPSIKWRRVTATACRISLRHNWVTHRYNARARGNERGEILHGRQARFFQHK